MFGFNKKNNDMEVAALAPAKADSLPERKEALNYIADSLKSCQKDLVANEVASLTELKDISDTFSDVMEGNQALKTEIYEFGEVFSKVSETTARFDEVRGQSFFLWDTNATDPCSIVL